MPNSTVPRVGHKTVAKQGWLQLAYSPYGRLWNFKDGNLTRLKPALEAVKANTAPAVICMIGDSTGVGHGTGTGTNGLDGALLTNPHRRLTDILNAEVLPTFNHGRFGAQGVANVAYDPRLVLGAGWSAISAGIAGGYWGCGSPTVTTLAFTPVDAFDTIAYWYMQGSSFGSFTVNVDGGATLETINSDGSFAVVKRTLSVPLGLHTLNFARSAGGNVRILGFTTSVAATKRLEIRNLCVLGQTSASAIIATNPWSPLPGAVAINAHCYIIELGINDWAGGVSPATYRSNMQTMIDVLRAVGDVVLVTSVPQAVATTALATQLGISDTTIDLAIDNDLPLIGLRQHFGTQEASTAKGQYYDSTHINSVGAAIKARIYAEAIKSL